MSDEPYRYRGFLGEAQDLPMPVPQGNSSDVTVEKIAKFNRALHPHVLDAAEEADISPHRIVLNAVFLMPSGRTILCNLGPPLTEEERTRAQVREVIEAWIAGDGFQEGADGATAVARILYGTEWTEEVVKQAMEKYAS